MDRRHGLKVGVLPAGEPHEFFVTVVCRINDVANFQVLDHEPKSLEVTLQPNQRLKNSYRLRIAIPAGVDNLIFNRPDQHGYVQVGDPDNPEIQSWFRLWGAVINDAETDWNR